MVLMDHNRLHIHSICGSLLFGSSFDKVSMLLQLQVFMTDHWEYGVEFQYWQSICGSGEKRS